MLHLFHSAGFTVAVAHANFALRGQESDADEQFVKDQCATLQVPCFTRVFETTQHAKANGISIQMAARELRYAWFDELCGQHGFTKVATAHHLNDSIETTLLHWIHGTSLEGLTGIPEQNGYVIRPLLFATRDDLQRYAGEAGLVWREDSSNQSTDYARNFIRHKVMPLLKELNPSLEETQRKSVAKLRQEEHLLSDALARITEAYVRWEGNRCLIRKAGVPSSCRTVVLWRLLRDYGFSFSVCTDIGRSMNHQPGKQFFSDTHLLVIDREELMLEPQTQPLAEVKILCAQSEATLGNWHLSITERGGEYKPLHGEVIVDAQRLVFPLTWRPWRPGDFFYPLGMGHRKKVSDFLVDQKVSLPDKSRITVVESAGNVVWVVGYRIDHRYRITPQTKASLCFALRT
jgi:tRNA(Ile)-lysidine synthase